MVKSETFDSILHLTNLECITALSLATIGMYRGTVFDSQLPVEHPLPRDEVSNYAVNGSRRPFFQRRGPYIGN